MEYSSVSIIISFFERFGSLERTFESFSHLDYPAPIEFILIDDANTDTDKVSRLIGSFRTSNPTYGIKFIRNEFRGRNTNILWNAGFHASTGDFVIYAHQDVIPSTKQIIQAMLNNYEGKRVSVLPYYLSYTMLGILDVINWKVDPRIVESIPGFWTDTSLLNDTRKDAKLLTLLTGQYRRDWEWFGLFRNNQEGYFWIDQDIAVREACLHKEATTIPPEEACCYHQWHEGHALSPAPGYIYKTEREARLIDPATIAP